MRAWIWSSKIFTRLATWYVWKENFITSEDWFPGGAWTLQGMTKLGLSYEEMRCSTTILKHETQTFSLTEETRRLNDGIENYKCKRLSVYVRHIPRH